MTEKQCDFLQHVIFTVIFTLIFIIICKLIAINNTNVDTIAQLADRAGVECQVKTNNCLFAEVHKIVK